MQAPAVPIQKNVLLVGAGNAHLRFVKMFGMKPAPGLAVTLVSEAPVIPYSAMVPAHIGGDYTWDEISIDLVRLCAAMKVRFVAGKAIAIDPQRRTVKLAGRPELSYDAVSLGLGSLPARPDEADAEERGWPLRPLASLIERVNDLERTLEENPRPFHLAIVGGGASGCELALAIRKRLARMSDLRITLMHGQDRLLPGFPDKAARLFEQELKARDITIGTGIRVTASRPGVLELNGEKQLECDDVLWATNAAPPRLFADSGLSLGKEGFLLVHDTLQSTGDPAVFGTGDCVSFTSYPGLLKNGVYAVRQGGLLYRNVVGFLNERPLKPFRPQRNCLCLLNLSDGTAALCYGLIITRSRWMRRLKDRIDRNWIDKFTRFPSMTPKGVDEHLLMRCGGCGNKVSGDVLSSVVKNLDIADDPRVLMGCKAGEDAAVHRLPADLIGVDAGKVEVQTVDYFKAFIDDPYLFGRIAALNSVSDLYAMNARPFSALAIATLPNARGPIQEAMLRELLSGAVESLEQMGVVLTGGHTTEGTELALGFSVTGYASEDKLFRKGGLRVGDKLILTRPLGTGALLAAWMRGECKAPWFSKLIDSMLLGNKQAAEIFARHEVLACTDVTGFGLAGHLLEMLDASQRGARIDHERVPLYDGFSEVVSQGIVSSLHGDNARNACRIHNNFPDWLFDPQTSGGMMAGVKPDAVSAVLADLLEVYPHARVIGEVVGLAQTEQPYIDVTRG